MTGACTPASYPNVSQRGLFGGGGGGGERGRGRGRFCGRLAELAAVMVDNISISISISELESIQNIILYFIVICFNITPN